jgi:uroporphyrinogen decarboxylase
MTGSFVRALGGEVLPTPPIWLMRQAGRYHAPYRHLRAQHGFERICRVPELAAAASRRSGSACPTTTGRRGSTAR